MMSAIYIIALKDAELLCGYLHIYSSISDPFDFDLGQQTGPSVLMSNSSIELQRPVLTNLQDGSLGEGRDEDVADGLVPVPVPDGLGQGDSKELVVMKDLRDPMKEDLHLQMNICQGIIRKFRP